MEIKNLLEKYYNGKTSLEEEKLLQKTLLAEENNEDDIYSRLLFNAFEKEKQEIAPESLKIFSPKIQKHKQLKNNKKRLWYIASGIAACFIITFSAINIINNYQERNTAYLVVNGIRIDDQELAIQRITKKLAKRNAILNKNLTAVSEMGNIEEKLISIIN